METITTVNLYTSFVMVMNKIVDITTELGKKETVGLLPFVVELQKLYCWCEEDVEVGQMMTCVCRSATPKKLLDFLLDIASDKV